MSEQLINGTEAIEECLNILRTKSVIFYPTIPANPTWIYVQNPDGTRIFEIHKNYGIDIVFDDGRRCSSIRWKQAYDLFDLCVAEFKRQEQREKVTPQKNLSR